VVFRITLRQSIGYVGLMLRLGGVGPNDTRRHWVYLPAVLFNGNNLFGIAGLVAGMLFTDCRSSFRYNLNIDRTTRGLPGPRIIRARSGFGLSVVFVSLECGGPLR